MIERQDPVQAWVAVSERVAQATGYRPAVAAGRWTGLASIGAMTVALALIVAGLALRPSADRLGANGPVTAAADDGMFRLELTTLHGTYGPDDAVEPVGRVTYLGPAGAITVQHSHSQLVFQIQEVDGVRAMDGGSRSSCESTNLVKGEPLVVPFAKSGSPDDPTNGFDLAWYRDPTLTLPVGTWRITVNMSFGIGGCGTDHVLHVSNVIHVVAPTGDGPVVDVADDGVFRFELSTPRRIYAPTDAIEPIATVSYLGPAADARIYHAGSIVGWVIDEVRGDRTMSGVMNAPCIADIIRKDTPLAFLFAKSGTIDETFDRAWFDDPVLHLPVGTWRIRAYTTIAADDGPAPSDGSFTCGTRGHSQDVAIVITVTGDAGEPSATAIPPSPTPSPTASPSPLPSFSADPVIGSSNDGTFRLDLITPHGVYGVEDGIAPVARLFYVGPDPSVTFGHSDPAVVFSIDEVSGDRSMTGSAADSCTFTTLRRDEISTIPFRKSGQIGLGFDTEWFRDPVLRLPPGTWRIRVRLEAYVPGCDAGADIHEPIAENVITVVERPAASPSTSASADADRAVGAVKDYEGALEGGRLDLAWDLLSPWSQSALGSRTQFASLVGPSAAATGALVIGQPVHDPELMAAWFLGDRATDLAANADPARSFLVEVNDPSVDGASAASTRLVVAPLADGSWRIWLDLPGS